MNQASNELDIDLANDVVPAAQIDTVVLDEDPPIQRPIGTSSEHQIAAVNQHRREMKSACGVRRANVPQGAFQPEKLSLSAQTSGD